MKSQKLFFALAGVATVFAIVSFVLVSFGTTNNNIFPTSLNSDPGGTLALYRLLQREGFSVEREFTRPRERKKDVGAVLYFERPLSIFASDPSEQFDASSYSDDVVIIRALTSYALPKRTEYSAVSVSSPFESFAWVKKVGQPDTFSKSGTQPILEAEGYYVISSLIEDGRVQVYVHNGTMLLNRFLARDDNAEMIVATIRSMVPEGKKIIFPEYAYGVGAPDNLFTRLGPTYSSTLIQLLVMLLFAIYTLGKRFGYPDHETPTKPGTGDFVKALADAFRRGRCTDIVLDTELRRALRIVSRKLNLPAELTEDEKLARVPGQLGTIMRALASTKSAKPSDKDMRAHLELLNVSLAEFEAGRVL
ncbi:MAG: hypothetical protein KIT74_11950 [Fimbriimonadales bacterium]|nr:hypothetical protein [Fimbriimonadales bacterium]